MVSKRVEFMANIWTRIHNRVHKSRFTLSSSFLPCWMMCCKEGGRRGHWLHLHYCSGTLLEDLRITTSNSIQNSRYVVCFRAGTGAGQTTALSRGWLMNQLARCAACIAASASWPNCKPSEANVWLSFLLPATLIVYKTILRVLLTSDWTATVRVLAATEVCLPSLSQTWLQLPPPPAPPWLPVQRQYQHLSSCTEEKTAGAWNWSHSTRSRFLVAHSYLYSENVFKSFRW
jgi:hypothetical protein